jgi:hypothetical protein
MNVYHVIRHKTGSAPMVVARHASQDAADVDAADRVRARSTNQRRTVSYAVLEVAHGPCEGDRVVATAGRREGQEGRIIDPTGVEQSWVRWKGGDVTTYPHEALELLSSPRRTGAR